MYIYVMYNSFSSFFLIFIFCNFVVLKNTSTDARETESPTPPLLVHNHVMNNVDYAKDEVKDKNSFNNDENHVPVKLEGSLARYVHTFLSIRISVLYTVLQTASFIIHQNVIEFTCADCYLQVGYSSKTLIIQTAIF